MKTAISVIRKQTQFTRKHIKFCVTLTVLLLFAAEAFAQDAGAEVFVEVYPETITASEPWTLTLFVNHGEADEVTVIAPQFAPSLSLDRFAKSPRVTGTAVQTAVEYRFVSNTPGRFTMESFTVITPGGSVETGRLYLEARASGAQSRPVTVRVVWEGAPAQMAAGERTNLALRAYGWNSRQPLSGFFMPEVPQGAIVSHLQITAQERESGLAARMTLIPLSGDFRLPARSLQYENFVFEIPALQIRVRGSAARESPAANRPQNAVTGLTASSLTASSLTANSFQKTDLEKDGAFTAENPAFPSFDFSVFDKTLLRSWKSQCENICASARDLWDGGFRAQALAQMRHNERNHPAGVFLRPIRREAEENIMLFNTSDESRLQHNFLFILTFFILLIVIITPFVCSIIIRNSPWKRIALLCAIILTMTSSMYIYLFMDSRNIFEGNSSRFGVTGETPVRKSVDTDTEILFTFREGQPVQVLLNSGSWLYVRANDSSGSSGWLPAEEVIFY